MDRAIELLVELLKIYNPDSGEFLKLIGDKTKTTPSFSGEVNVNDIDTGAISNILEYTRRLNLFLVSQLNINYASLEWLDFIGEGFYNLPRDAGESDEDYRIRIKQTVFQLKETPIRIEDALEFYGDNVRVIEGIDDGAFADISFTECYRDFSNFGEYIVKAALASDESGLLLFFFRVIMENVLPEDYGRIINIIENFKVAGVTYEVEIITS